MTLAIPLTAEQEAELARLAAELRVSPHELAAAALRDLLTAAQPDFTEAARRVLEKNAELYRRLS